MAGEALEATPRSATRGAAAPVSGAREGTEDSHLPGLPGRLGIDVPAGSWPSPPLLKSFEAAGFYWAQIHAPPESVLTAPRRCTRHAEALRAALETTELRLVAHSPWGMRVGTTAADRAFEGLLYWCSEAGVETIVYHARALPDERRSQEPHLFETRSLARLAPLAERLGITIALENLAPAYQEIEPVAATPLALRTLVRRIGSDRIGICLDLGHAHIAADLRHTTVDELCEPVLDMVRVFHVHDNLGARREVERPPELDPLRLDLHLEPGRGTLPWERVADLLTDHTAPLLLEVHSPYQPRLASASRSLARLLSP
jgi:sugar phosphate isomerase/epimerase